MQLTNEDEMAYVMELGSSLVEFINSKRKILRKKYIASFDDMDATLSSMGIALISTISARHKSCGSIQTINEHVTDDFEHLCKWMRSQLMHMIDDGVFSRDVG